jgi:hypothetical protein
MAYYVLNAYGTWLYEGPKTDWHKLIRKLLRECAQYEKEHPVEHWDVVWVQRYSFVQERLLELGYTETDLEDFNIQFTFPVSGSMFGTDIWELIRLDVADAAKYNEMWGK